MIKSLWIKFLILLFFVVIIALSSALLLRELMVRDFRALLEGEEEDHVYAVTAELESSYEKYGNWHLEAAQQDAVWGLMLGFDTRLLNRDGVVIMDTERALRGLSHNAALRVQELSTLGSAATAGSYFQYPLFFRGEEVGKLEVRFLHPKRETVFIKRSNYFLFGALGVLGGVAVILSVIFSNKLTRPLKNIASAATAISEGNLLKRVDVKGQDELADLAEVFNRMAHTLQIQDGLRKKLISNIAHELRTPLTAVQGEIEGMMDGLIPTGGDQLQSLHEEVRRLKKMLEGMEELTRAQASALTLKKRKIEAKPFLKNIAERMGRPVLAKGIIITVECEDGLTASADPDRLSEIVINLVSNAVKAAEQGGTVTITAVRENMDLILEVRDTGIGIKEEDKPFIFERFYKGFSGGLGLGLAIVRELVHAHGGTIDAQSTYGKGSVFTVRLPA
jgi:signal transduction histidine kinase